MSFLFLLLAFQVKHLVVDFLYQPTYMWKNKGTFLHPGGLYHAGLHGIVTCFILVAITPHWLVIAFGEMVAHYLIDYAKMNIVAKHGWKCNTDEKFWFALGIDQFAHQVCYLVMIGAVYTLQVA